MRKLTFFFVFLLFPTVSMAQVSDEVCLALARSIAIGDRERLSDNQIKAIEHFSRCQITQDSRSRSANIAYKAFGFDGSDQRDRSRSDCATDYSNLDFDLYDYQRATVLFEKSLATIDRCLQAAGQNWQVDYQPISTGFTIGVGHTGGLGGSFNGYRIEPPDSLECTGLPEDPFARRPVTNQDPLNLTCSRRIFYRSIGGEEYEYARDANLILSLDQNQLVIPVSGFEPAPISELTRRVTELENQLDSLISRQTALQTDYNGPSFQFQSIVGNRRAPPPDQNSCPPGTVVTGARVADRVGGNAAVDAIARIELYCSQLVRD